MIEILSSAIALLAVGVSAYAVWESKRTQLNAAYFAEKTEAYRNFLSCASEFVLTQSKDANAAFAAAVYHLQLFAPHDIQEASQEYYRDLVAAAKAGTLVAGSSGWADRDLYGISSAMKADLASFRKR